MPWYKNSTWFRKSKAPVPGPPLYKRGDEVWSAAPRKAYHKDDNRGGDLTEYYNEQYVMGTILIVIPRKPPTTHKNMTHYPDQEYLVCVKDGPTLLRKEEDLILLSSTP